MRNGADAEHFADVARHQADGGLFEIVDGKVEDLFEDVGGELDVKPGRQAMNQELPQERECRLEGDDHQHRDAQYIEGIVCLVEDHLVRQQAPEHDRRQAKKSQDQRRDCDVPNHAALAEQQRGDETETERLRFVGDFIVALDQNDISRPDVLEARPIDHKQRVFRCVRIPQYNARVVGVSVDAQQHHVASVAQTNNGRERLFQMREPVPIELDELRPHARLLRGADELIRRHFLIGQQVVLDELR